MYSLFPTEGATCKRNLSAADQVVINFVRTTDGLIKDYQTKPSCTKGCSSCLELKRTGRGGARQPASEEADLDAK